VRRGGLGFDLEWLSIHESWRLFAEYFEQGQKKSRHDQDRDARGEARQHPQQPPTEKSHSDDHARNGNGSGKASEPSRMR
jgi:hypothetical protein